MFEVAVETGGITRLPRPTDTELSWVRHQNFIATGREFQDTPCEVAFHTNRHRGQQEELRIWFNSNGVDVYCGWATGIRKISQQKRDLQKAALRRNVGAGFIDPRATRPRGESLRPDLWVTVCKKVSYTQLRETRRWLGSIDKWKEHGHETIRKQFEQLPRRRSWTHPILAFERKGSNNRHRATCSSGPRNCGPTNGLEPLSELLVLQNRVSMIARRGMIRP